MRALWRWILRHVVGVYVEPTPRDRLFAVIGRSSITRITRSQAQTERPSTV